MSASESIGSIAVPTRDNAEELRLSIGSCVAEAARLHRALEILVVDDSRRLASIDANHEILTDAARAGHVVHHATPASRARFTEALVERVGHRDVIEFALLAQNFDSRHGAARNTIALALSGRRFFSLDDDMSLCAFASPNATSETYGSAGDPTELWFFDSESDARRFAERDPLDLLEAHRGLLERTAATWTGFYGHSGTPSPLLYLLADERSHERLLQASFDDVTKSRSILRAVRGATTATGGFWTTGAAAYGADPTPPFFPILRGEGLVFGALVATCTRAVLGHVPAVVEHRAGSRIELEPMDFELAAKERSLAPTIASMTHAFAKTLRAEGHVPNLKNVGAKIAAIGERGWNEGLGDLAMKMQELRCRSLAARLRSRLSRMDPPSSWRNAASRFLRALEKAEGDRAFAMPTDLRDEVGRAAAEAEMAEVTRLFGRLLVLWNAMHAHAADLRASGVSVAERIV